MFTAMVVRRFFEYLLPNREEGSGHLLVTDLEDGCEPPPRRTCISVKQLLEDILQDAVGDTWSKLQDLFQTNNVKGSDLFRKVR